jgi:hypothetical protein
MPAQKLRHPQTPAAAITRLIGVLGAEACAQAVSKSPQLVYGWADPDSDSWPNLIQIDLLERLWVTSGQEDAAPITEWLLRSRERALYQLRPGPSPLERVADVVADVGLLAGEVRRDLEDGGLSENAKSRIAACVDAARKDLDALDAQVAPPAAAAKRPRK